MDRKQFLKSACGLGACGCALTLGVAPLAEAAAAEAEDQRLAFVKHQVAKMVGFVAADAPEPTCVGILQKTGGECARLGGLAARFKGDPEKYFATARKAWGTEFTWDEAKGLITVTGAETECSCPLVDTKKTPPIFCNCAAGYQKETFETIFGRPVQATLKQTQLAGSKRCVFEVRLQEPTPKA